MKRERLNAGKIHYAWWILLGCCMLQGGTLGVILNCCGVFYVPVCTDLGFLVGDLTMYRTVAGVTALVTMPLVSRIFNRYDSRVVLTAAALLFTLPTMAMSMFTRVEHWYMAGAVQGVVSNLVTMVAPPILLSNWFKEKAGLAIGISSSCSGIMGAIFISVVSGVVEKYGWRTGYVVNAALALVIVLPATLLILRYEPAAMGMRAYGEAHAVAAALPEETGLPGDHRKLLLLVVLAASGATFAAGFASFLNAYGVSVGLGAAGAALLASAAMVGNTSGKLIAGEMNDRLGTRWPALLCYAAAMLGCLALVALNAPLIYGAALLFGFCMPAYTTMPPLITRTALGRKDFARYYPKVTMVVAMVAALMVTVHGWLFDRTGSYRSSLLLSAAGLAVSCLMTLLLFWRKRVGAQEQAEREIPSERGSK